MDRGQFPALYRCADDLSNDYQQLFFLALGAYLVLLIVGAVLSALNSTLWQVAAAQAVIFVIILALTVYLFLFRPDRYWYGGRAVAESIKTLTWRYISRAEPFNVTDEQAEAGFRSKLSDVIKQNADVARNFSAELAGLQITDEMRSQRSSGFAERYSHYVQARIGEQLTWYAERARANRKAFAMFFSALIVVNILALIFAVLKVKYSHMDVWPTDPLIAVSAVAITWIQAKRFSQLAASYALTAHEISLIREQANAIRDDAEFSNFVSDAENAFSREHTQWVARKDS